MGTAELQLLVKARDEASSALGNIAKAAVGLGLAFVAGAAAAIKAAADEQVGIVKLQQAVRNAGRDWDEVAGAIEGTVSMMEKLAFSDDQVRESLSILIPATGDLQDAQDRMRVAMDLSRGTGLDLASASKLLGKVTDENTTVLKRYGIVVEKGATATQLLDEVTRRFGGQAAAFAGTAAGQLEIFQNEMANVVEDVGAVLLPMFTEGIKVVSGFITALRGSGALEAVAAVFKNIVDVVGEMLGVISGQAPDAGAKLKAIVGPGAASEIMGGLANIREGFKAAFAFVQEHVIPPLTTAFEFLRTHWESTSFAMKAVALTVLVPAFIAWAAAAGAAALATIVAMAPVLLAVGAVALAAFALHEAWENNFLGIRDIAQAAGDFLGPLLAGIGDFLGRLGEAAQTMAPMFLGAFDLIKATIAGTIEFITAPIRGLIDIVMSAIGWLQSLGVMQASVRIPTADAAHNERSAIHAAGGFDGIVTRPTLFMAGEAGIEHVRVTPGGGSGGGVTVNVHVAGSVWSSGELAEEITRVVTNKLLAGGFRGTLRGLP